MLDNVLRIEYSRKYTNEFVISVLIFVSIYTCTWGVREKRCGGSPPATVRGWHLFDMVRWGRRHCSSRTCGPEWTFYSIVLIGPPLFILVIKHVVI
jgi:hypothetical protein